MAAPTSPKRTSIPASLIPVSVASFAAISKLSYFGLNATVNALSIIHPSTYVPKSILQTSSYPKIVLSPELGL